MVLSLAGAVAIFLSAGSFGLWYARRSNERLEVRLKALAAEGRASVPLSEVPFAHRVLVPLVGGLSSIVIGLLPPAVIARARRQLVAAGQPLSLSAFFAAVLVVSILVPAAVMLIAWVASEGSVAAGTYVLIPVLAGLGGLLPFLWVSRRVRGRQQAIWRSLPDAFDLITTCVEAGLGLDASFDRVSEKLAGPVSEEFAETLREVAMGKSRRDALRDMGERTGVGDLQTFANAILQAEELGTSLGTVLRGQSTQMRLRRRQRAEEEARRAPGKMVFPLVFFILPSLFVIILAPVLIEVFELLAE
jgi:tight adherence protein C